MRNRLFLTSTVVLVAVSAFTVIAWGADSNVGTWKLNLDKSTYSPGPAPKSATLTIEAHDGGIKYTSHGENAEGSPIHIEFTAKYDGKDNPVTGSPDFNSIALKRIDAHTVESTTKKDRTVMLTSPERPRRQCRWSNSPASPPGGNC